MKRIIWTLLHKANLAQACAKHLSIALHKEPEDLTESDIRSYYGFFTDIVMKAQHELSQADSSFHIRKSFVSFIGAEWLIEKMIAITSTVTANVIEAPALEEQPTHLEPMFNQYEAALKTLAELIAPLVAQKVVDMLQVEVKAMLPTPPQAITVETFRKHVPNPVTVIKAYKPRIAVVGLLGVQQQEIANSFADKADLRFVDQELSKSVLTTINQCDAAVANVGKTSHARDGALKKRFNEKYIRVSGGVTATKRAIEVLLGTFKTI